MKEYWPADYAKHEGVHQAGPWFPAGSSMEEGDVNAPSAEAILRQLLYGNEYFRKEFGVASEEFMLPDCFGFPWSLPSLLAHAGIKGFSTQKLTWGSSVPDQATTPAGMEGQGIPFNVGVWIGPDGSCVVAALNPGSYSGGHRDLSSDDLSTDDQRGSGASAPPTADAKLGVFADYHYYGTGDIGGSPRESSVTWIEKSVTDTNGPLDVLSATADQLFLDLTPAEIASAAAAIRARWSCRTTRPARSPRRRIRSGGSGRNELLADGAEKASVAAAWLGGRAYPMHG